MILCENLFLSAPPHGYVSMTTTTAIHLLQVPTNCISEQPPVEEEFLTETEKRQEQAPIEELIERVESSKVEGMDDRLSESSEDSMIVREEPKGS